MKGGERAYLAIGGAAQKRCDIFVCGDVESGNGSRWNVVGLAGKFVDDGVVECGVGKWVSNFDVQGLSAICSIHGLKPRP